MVQKKSNLDIRCSILSWFRGVEFNSSRNLEKDYGGFMVRVAFILMLLFVIGCGAGLQKQTVDFTVNVNEKYQDLRDEYIEEYDSSPPEMQEWMQEEIAPKLNKARESIIDFNTLVLDGTGGEEEKRKAIVETLVEVERLMEVL